MAHALDARFQENATGPDFPEDIRLIIWDLDETFWLGTLTEGGISFIEEHHALIIDLAKRGIMSSICSKNNFDDVEKILVDRGLWQYFIFASIDWSPKAPRVREQVDEIGLRPAAVLFIDDNPQNLQQVLAEVPGINIADPNIIPKIANHHRFRGKPDPDLTRLSQYKNNEIKFVERKAFSGDNVDFLRRSDIRVYFEYDVEKHIDRVVELINRTNQLNFTKERLPEDQGEARASLIKFLRHAGITTGLVKVVDKFGDYGFVGFYAMTEINHKFTLKHFCFSCRTLNMYVEHFVYDFIGRPTLNVVGEVLSDVQSNALKIDWIRALPIDKLQETGGAGDVTRISSIYARGGCDLSALLHYFSLNCENIVGEFNGLKNWQSLRLDHSAFLVNAIRGLSSEEMSAAEELGYDEMDFRTQFPRANAVDWPEVCLLSFWADADIPVYRHRATGLELPYFLIGAGREDLTRDEATIDRLRANDIQRQRLSRLRDNWDYSPGLTGEQMVDRYRRLLSMMPPQTRIFMTLANDRHPAFFGNPQRYPPDERHQIYNRALAEAVVGFSNIVLVDFAAYVTKADDILDINHLRRDLYFKIYSEIMKHLDSAAATSSSPGTSAKAPSPHLGNGSVPSRTTTSSIGPAGGLAALSMPVVTMSQAQDLIRTNDPSVFVLDSVTGDGDRRALLRILNMAGSRRSGYSYADVGSYMGGTLVAPLLDERCARVVSIDMRPDLSPDERGVSFSNRDASTDAMLQRLRSKIPDRCMSKLETFELDASELPAGTVEGLDIVFIDGEHTNKAAFSDFMALWPARSPDCIFCFHNANLISDALCNVETFLRSSGVYFKSFCLRDAIFVILVGNYIDQENLLSPFARDKEAYFKWSKEQLWRGIADTYQKLGVRSQNPPPP